MDFLKNMVKVIGCAFVTVIFLGIPIITSLSIIYNWHGFIKMILVLAFAVEFVGVCSAIYNYVDE